MNADLFAQPDADAAAGPARASAAEREPVETLVWFEPEQARLLAGIAERAQLNVVQAGVPVGDGRSAAAADAIAALGEGVTRFDDLRHAIASTTAKLVLIASPASGEAGAGNVGGAGGSGESILDDPDVVRLCRERGSRLCTFEPAPASVGDHHRFEAVEGDEPVRIVPMLRRSRVFRDAMELIEQLGKLRSVFVEASSGPGEGTLAARLFDAMATVHALLGMPDRLDASLAPPAGGETGQSVRALRGDLHASLRYTGSRCAGVALTDRGGRWSRRVLVVGDEACLRIDDSALTLHALTGETLDESTIPEDGATAEAGAAPIFARAIARAVDPHAPRPAPIGRAEVLAMCAAVALSARTGDAEHPPTLLRMGGG